ncbi:MAG TPA: hydrogenase maturation nickel metallochaperone HypA, partial [Aggregatilineales bacterium]|nr:hydrogenase maturation nickel metallochaperone HypA [Aggregatilineales bacterium]
LKIGDLSSIVDESVQFYWDIISQDTPAQNAKLHFERIPATMRCLDCSECYQLRHRDEFTCPHCGGTAVQLVSGDEFCVEAIDVQIPAVNAIDSSC